MVQGLANVRALHGRLGRFTKAELIAQIEKDATALVAEMDRLKPIPEIVVGWTWGEEPAGSVTVGRVAGRQFERIGVTIYATAPQGSGFSASWFEFGTLERFHKSGKSTGRITAGPFFFPSWRANRTRLRGGLSRAVTRAVKRAAQ